MSVVDSNNARLRKRVLRYVCFDGDDATLTNDIGSAAQFHMDDQQYLMTANYYISTEGSISSAPFKRTTLRPSSAKHFKLNADGSLSLDGANGFCISADGTMNIVYDTPPRDCAACSLKRKFTLQPNTIIS